MDPIQDRINPVKPRVEVVHNPQMHDNHDARNQKYHNNRPEHHAEE